MDLARVHLIHCAASASSAVKRRYPHALVAPLTMEAFQAYCAAHRPFIECRPEAAPRSKLSSSRRRMPCPSIVVSLPNHAAKAKAGATGTSGGGTSSVGRGSVAGTSVGLGHGAGLPAGLGAATTVASGAAGTVTVPAPSFTVATQVRCGCWQTSTRMSSPVAECGVTPSVRLCLCCPASLPANVSASLRGAGGGACR